jgi:TetR/AcrR family transcriptional regulator, cholesterol catabolism regulator
MEDQTLTKRDQIIDKAIEFFSRSGIAETKIEDITSALGIGKGTFYLYFKSKKDLLANCIGRLATIVVPKEVWDDIRGQADYGIRSRKRLVAFLKAYPTFFGILNFANESLQSARDPSLAKEAYDTYRLLAGPLIKDFRWAVNAGLARKMDEDVLAFLLIGIGESLGNLQKIDPRFTPEELADAAWDFVLHGIDLSGTAGSEPRLWHITDTEGHVIRLRNIHFDDKYYLSGRLGKGQLHIRPENAKSFAFEGKNATWRATVSTTNGDSITLVVDGSVLLSGEADLGRYSIPLTQVAQIAAEDKDKT